MIHKILFCLLLIICVCPAQAQSDSYCFSSASLERLNNQYSSLDTDFQNAHNELYVLLADKRFDDMFDADSQLCITPSDIADICLNVWGDDDNLNTKCEEFVKSIIETYDFHHVCSASSVISGTCVSDFVSNPDFNLSVDYNTSQTLARLYIKQKWGYDDIVCHDDIKHENNYDLLACSTTTQNSTPILFDFKFREISPTPLSDTGNTDFALALGHIYSQNDAYCNINTDNTLAKNIGFETAIICANQTQDSCTTAQTNIEQNNLPYTAIWVPTTGCAIGLNASKIAKFLTNYKIPENRYNEIRDLLAATVQAEAGLGDPIQQKLVCDVILNRVTSRLFKEKSIDAVIKAKGQFSTYPRKINQILSQGINPQVIPIVEKELNASSLNNKYIFFWTPAVASRYGFPCLNKHGNHCYYASYPKK